MRSLARNLVRRNPLTQGFKSQAGPAFVRPSFMGLQSTQRSFNTAQNLNKDQVSSLVQQYHDELLGTNWGNYMDLVQNVPFFEAQLEKVQANAEPYLSDPEIGKKLEYCLMATDAMYACEDVRDHINEILEILTRKTGVMGLGIYAGESIDNMDEQVEMLSKEYLKLLEKYPEMKPKIEQSVGHGMALLRMKYKFPMPSGHRFFF